MQENRNERFWGDHADIYDTEIDRVIGSDSRQAIFDYLLTLPGLGDAIEFGCGPGFFTRAIARNARSLLATDISERMLDRARQNVQGHPHVRFRKLDCEETGLKSDTFDTVFTANVVMILERPDRAIAEAYRILKPGGRLILLFYTMHGVGIFDRFRMMVRFMARFRGVPFKHFFTMGETRALAERAGFRIDELKYIGGPMKAIYLEATKLKTA